MDLHIFFHLCSEVCNKYPFNLFILEVNQSNEFYVTFFMQFLKATHKTLKNHRTRQDTMENVTNATREFNVRNFTKMYVSTFHIYVINLYKNKIRHTSMDCFKNFAKKTLTLDSIQYFVIYEINTFFTD